ncbi:MAG: hypothetical protein A2785_04215 [Candidatus Chisholmbacteria bacterium RIFCSPHIGHO2_01_FULL_49_18]|uniref:N-acetyltransferase domain-containing protein n=2 Tax=Candidatus Chisholmiibacteriota TaxID=1817900 RepID=A0A1G1VP67_9BACT|nr:MAG: hypothetical protein A2785_04215 [Candidatus Chisholmbacteria bacterium RIFCSPHIGHO2_01_FULL_49_18]OGY22529.1 MAG: hypothetical protein A3A65_00880 [Candidatus Chisholmbacteria bacterium RIFCSPLOWO2_01_FULL_49_14]
MTITVRVATPKDFAAIQRMNNEVFVDNAPYDEYLNLKWPHSAQGEKYYRNALSDLNFHCLIAKADGEPVGYLIGKKGGYGYRTGNVAEIDNMGVSPSLRSQGIGSRLVREFKTWCKQEGVERIYVNVYFAITRAISFYERQGLIRIDLSLEGNI